MREPMEFLVDMDELSLCFPNVMLVVWHPVGACGIDGWSPSRLNDLTLLMAEGCLPIGFVAMDDNLEPCAMTPTYEFGFSPVVSDLLHEAYYRRMEGRFASQGQIIRQRLEELGS